MNINTTMLVIAIGLLSFSSCVSKKKFTDATSHISRLTRELGDTKESLKETQEQLADTRNQLQETSGELRREKELNETLNSRLSQAVSTSSSVQEQLTEKERRLLEQQERLDQLQNLLDEQRAVMTNLKATVDRALNQYRSDELQIYEQDGKLYVSLQDKLLFPSGSATVNREGREALGKLAEVLNSNDEIQIMVEGHTDNVPIRGRFEDNWALSTARATAIVRILTATYNVAPERAIAAGRSYYEPKAPNDTAEGRAKNRRTEIILTPKLDELFNLLQQ
jgi:chemotaxis protein MotB